MFPTSSNKRLVRYETRNPRKDPIMAGGDSRATAMKMKSPLEEYTLFQFDDEFYY